MKYELIISHFYNALGMNFFITIDHNSTFAYKRSCMILKKVTLSLGSEINPGRKENLPGHYQNLGTFFL
jgi:hypothetical protein